MSTKKAQTYYYVSMCELEGYSEWVQYHALYNVQTMYMNNYTNIREGLPTLSLYNAALLVRRFFSTIDFLRIFSIIDQSRRQVVKSGQNLL